MIDQRVNASNFHRTIERIVKKLFLNKITPNLLTVLALCAGLCGALLLAVISFFNFPSGFHSALSKIAENWAVIFTWEWQIGDTLYFIAVILIVWSFFLDICDGTLARIVSPTKWGGIMDIFFDRWVEISILIALICHDPATLLWPGLFSMASIVLCITIFLLIGGALSQAEVATMTNKKKVIYYAGGLMERTETFIFILLLIFLSPLRIYLLWLFGVLVLFTAFQRFRQGYKIFHGSS